MRTRSIVVALTASLAATSPTLAAPTALDASARHALMLRYAACVVQREPEVVRKYLFERASVQDRSEFEKLASVPCVKEAGIRDFRSFRAQSAAMAGAWGELALAKLPTTVEAGFAGAAPLVHVRELSMADYDPKKRLNREQFAAVVERSNRDRGVMVLAECVVRAAPAQSRAFVATGFGSPAEKAAVQPLGPALTSCVGGGSVKLLPQQLRGALAFNYLRLAVAVRPELAGALF